MLHSSKDNRDTAKEAVSLFHFKQFSLDQTGASFKLNTDGLLLATWLEAANSTRILDIGTGTGALALIMAQRYAQAQVEAVELDAVSAALAERNFANSPWASRLKLWQGAVQDFEPTYTYSHILSNPPYYPSGAHIPASRYRQARQTDSLPFEALLQAVERLLAPQGQFSLVLPIAEAELWAQLAQDQGWQLQADLRLRSRPSKAPRLRLMTWARETCPNPLSQEEAYLQETEQRHPNYSAWYKARLSDFLQIFED